MYSKIITLDALIFIHGTMLLFVLSLSLNFMCFYQSLHTQSSNTFFSTPTIMVEFVAMLQKILIIYLAEKHSCFLSVDTVHYSVIFSLLQCNFLDSAVVAELSAFLAIFSFSLIQESRFAFVAAFFEPLRFIVLSQPSPLFLPLLKTKLSLAIRLLHCIVILSLSHYRNVLFPGEDKAVVNRKIVALYSYFEHESLSKCVISWWRQSCPLT